MSFDPVNILISLPAVFLAMSFHEYAHAFAAHQMGDHTPKNQGRLTLDPLAHVDWIGLIMFAVFKFGWAKPVEINASNFKNRKWGAVVVSLAGPASNIILAIVAFILLLIIEVFFPASGIFFSIIEMIVILNIVFAILNLVPIHPFDGYNIIKTLFFRKKANLFWSYERYSLLILFAFILFNIFHYIVMIPAVSIYSWMRTIGFYTKLLL